MRHYRFKLVFLFLAMLCCSGHAFGQTQWLDVGPNCSDGTYYGLNVSASCATYGSSFYGYFPVSAFANWNCTYAVYALASASTFSGGGFTNDAEAAQSELAYNGTDPGFDEGYDEFLDAEGNGYSEGGGWVGGSCGLTGQ